ncbi:hypothetical protein ScPMuIL_017281 [Solemya velum]
MCIVHIRKDNYSKQESDKAIVQSKINFASFLRPVYTDTSSETSRLALPSCGQVRFMSKVNIKHPRPRHLIRRIMEQVVRPIIVEEPEKWKTCTEKKIEETEVNPFEEFLVRHCQRMFEQNKMIIVCQPLPMTAEEQKAINNKFIKKGMTLQFQSNKVVRRVITDTKFTNMLPWIM